MAKGSTQRYKKKRNTSLGFSTKMSKAFVQRRPFFIKPAQRPNLKYGN